ncbi:hypothetical protein V1520DRAFT_343653 [Lipomyces starkeyi]|uniref:Peroxisomal hydratase-dehydrogenase-epimerase n=1 Tax=Lipomyces starkeyi NRRL Y-11557 TaxID=675824 RepID=A0A1E3PW17_LIPST|nr:hypothetical protein LIPSTDRAFT_75883 [Lipomyces starkeyi NRRL Y-11557]
MPHELRFDGQTVVITGAGGGLGRAYALFFGSRGANVVVNDLGSSSKGEGHSTKAADVVVEEIKKAGGNAVPNYDSVEFGDRIVETAIKAFGSVHVLINNAGILRDISFKNMKDADWDLIQLVHLKGAYKTTKAAWPVFRKQKFGRIINTASAAGLYGSFGQANYSAAKLGLVGFTETLAKEGAKYGIFANVIAPMAASRMTQTVMPEDLLSMLKPEWVVPLVSYLTHKDTDDTGGIYEVGAGFVSKLRWERSNGALFKTDDSFTPASILARWSEIQDFESKTPQYPTGPNDFMTLLESARELPSNKQGDVPVDVKDKVVIVTGSGGGLGRAYALLFAKLGAKLVINDVGDPNGTVNEINKLYGEGTAISDRHSVEEGDAVVKTAVDHFGTVHVVVNNAGILRDKSFASMTDDLWDQVIAVHLRGTYKITKAAWPYFLKQKFGRIVNTTSTSGIYGNFGQANYATAKCAIIGFTKTIALEGKKYNIFANAIAPNAGTNMTRTILPEEIVQAFKPDYVAPLAVLLSSDRAPVTGEIFETGSGWIGNTRWQRTGGVGFPVDKPLTPEAIQENWAKITDFSDGRATYPKTTQESMGAILENMSNKTSVSSSSASEQTGPDFHFSYETRDLILYNLGVGAKASELKYVFEGADDFTVLPTYGVVPYFGASGSLDFSELVPNFNPMMLLHGEQYLEIKSWPLPTSGGRLVSKARLIEVLDKGKAACVITGTETNDAETGKPVFYNESTIVLRGSGGFGGPSKGKDRGAATAANTPPKRAPDFVAVVKTTEDQAAIYRLSGDYNPLHIDPEFAAVGKFPKPILHGLCTFGIAGKQIYDKFGMFKNIKVRFAGHVFPGETLKVEMWKLGGGKIIFQTTVIERNTVAISSAAVELITDTSKL